MLNLLSLFVVAAKRLLLLSIGETVEDVGGENVPNEVAFGC